tara:strand:+ start:154292 stop:155128 length:837 start_codon:yes stop_codon:yes gene_type:complete
MIIAKYNDFLEWEEIVGNNTHNIMMICYQRCLVKLISMLIIFLVAIIAGSYPFLKRLGSERGREFPIGESLAAGVFLGAGLLHMLGDSAQEFNQLGYHYPIPFLLAGIMFLFLLWLEHLGREMQEHKGAGHPGFAVLAFVMLSIHSFLAGAALGLSATWSVFIVIFLAILAHKWAASFALAVQITKTTMSNKVGMLMFLVFALMTPFGILVGSVINQGTQHMPLLEPIFSALAAGTFLYLGTLHGLSNAIMVQKCCNLRNFSFVIVGFAVMAVVAVWS